MNLANITAISLVSVYWLKIIIGSILFFTGSYYEAALVLLVGIAIEILLYNITMRN